MAPSPALTGAWQRLSGPGRLEGVDLARGLAVIGMLASHLLTLAPFDPADPGATWPDLVNGRSSILFATLAGVSIGLMTGGTRIPTGERRRDARFRIAVRAGVIWLIGVVLVCTLLPVFVILPAYGILFLLALPLLGLSARALFAIAAVVAVGMPFLQPILSDLPLWENPYGHLLALLTGWHYPFTLWFAFLAAGMGLARLGLRSIAVCTIGALVGLGIAFVAFALSPAVGEGEVAGDYWARVWTGHAHSSGLLEAVGSGAFAIAVICLCMLLCRTPVRWLVLPLRAVGSMPLTAYTAQLLAWAAWALVALGTTESLLGFRALGPFWPLTIALVLACTAWALTLGRGPLEWVLDTVSRIPERERAPAPDPGRETASERRGRG
ncbi:heparan-alpha-glucosaminide N-acetyltransferase domain-containing protein [Microbacterium sp. X-17]|uniref:heparan-alpha-glucosaminide N-acetyltransferase domain-containing protein n=1 Tax=Microbacterium sp. X-17 TaxID=3144404 RepID=UPI0031F59778